MPCSDRLTGVRFEEIPGALEPAADGDTTVALLYREFGDVLIPLEAVRLRYFRNRNSETFRRALREGDIPLPVVTLDDSNKSPRYICLYQLAAYIEHRSRAAADERETAHPYSHQARLNRALTDAVPVTDFRPATAAE
ncbi:pyocin activator PrtN family protein [Halomonas flagellata]|uniref:pyocin activator PrtN family protein n=1 Tax=Halomonas flagellata TaxID=2920385 RepID=UPI0023E7EB78|nr:pyocin activator PrtN family protein [Halomonas flagellata]